MQNDNHGSSTQRIQQAYSPHSLEQLGHHLVEQLAAHLAELQQGKHAVLNWNTPDENLAVARETLSSSALDVPDLERFQKLISIAISRGHNLHHPRYIGHQVAASVPLAGLFDALGSITNQVMAIYEMGPWATSVERALVEAWGETFGHSRGNFTGFITHGGSLANLTALLTARNVVFPQSWEQGFAGSSKPPVLIAHADAHYCVTRSAGILGLGTAQVVKAELNDKRQMDPQKLDDLLTSLRAANSPIMAVSSAACATPIGAFDAIDDIADVCEKHAVWLHVDAAHGGGTVFSSRHRHLVHGIDRADSFICDAHKMLFMPALCAFVFYKNPAHRYETFQQEAPYLFDPSQPNMAAVDSGVATIECTKRAASYGLWGVWSMFGPELFGEIIDKTFALTKSLYGMLTEAVDFAPLHVPQANILVFRYLPDQKFNMNSQQIGELNRSIRRRIVESGEFYIVQTNLDGSGALRVCVMNPLTEETHLLQLLDSIRKTAAELLNE